MTEKTLPSEKRISRENVARTKQVSYEHYDILLRNKFSFCSLNLFLGSDHQKQYLVWFPFRSFSALKFSLAKMASERTKLTSQNGISTSL